VKKFLLLVVVLAVMAGYAISQKNIELNYNDYGIQDVTIDRTMYFVTREFDDGPYLVQQDGALTGYTVKKGKLQVNPVVQPARFPMTYAVNQVDTFQGARTIAAFSDIHGQIGVFEQLLLAHGIVDAQNNWNFGDGHLVITGDLLDKGDGVTEALWLLYKLEQQAQQQGGKLHYLLGNHEFMLLRGDYTFVHPKYLESMRVIGKDLQSLLGEDTVLGQWLRSKSTIIKLNDIVFVHAGIHQSYLDLDLALEESNALFRGTIGVPKPELLADPVLGVLYGNNGPVWYRGLLRDRDLKQVQVDHVLDQLDADYIVFGHTSMQQVETRHDHKVIAIDTSIKKGKKGEVLFWRDGVFFSGDMDGTQSRLF
jgi:hypothetical protein